MKNIKVDSLFDSHSHDNLIVVDLVIKLGLEVHDHPIPYPLRWVNKDGKIKVMKHFNINFILSAYFIDKVE